jgi:hypothetical protein
MTVRHIVLMSFPDGRDPDFIDRMASGLREMRASVPDILDASWGEDRSGGQEAWEYALVLDFADEDAYQRYRSHPAHQRFIGLFMRERAIEKARVRYTF